MRMIGAPNVSKYLLRFGALGYLALILLVPVGFVFYRAFRHGLGPAWDAVSSPPAVHALELTLLMAAVAVPANTIFGVTLALALVRTRLPGRGLVNAIVDLPLALSPVVAGLALFLLYGRGGWLGGLADHGIKVLFSIPGMILATMFVSLPFVVREVVPVLREIGTEQEQAAETLGASPFQTFRKITLPAIRWAVAYGVVLTTARAIGEFGAVSVVSGRIEGRTQTLPLYVQAQFEQFDVQGAYAVSVVLALIAIGTVVGLRVHSPPRGLLMGIAAIDVTKRFGDFTALDDVSVDDPGRLAHGPARPERQRQVDAPARHRGPRAARVGAGADRRTRTSPTGRHARAASEWSSSTTRPSST